MVYSAGRFVLSLAKCCFVVFFGLFGRAVASLCGVEGGGGGAGGAVGGAVGRGISCLGAFRAFVRYARV